MHTWIWAWIFALVFVHAVLSEDIERDAIDPSLLWGPYRPNVYFGMRPRIPQSLLMGLMWAKTEDGVLADEDLRHTCEQSDRMAGYGWDSYDPRTGGSQTIHDVSNFIDMTTEFWKPSDENVCCQWGLRISGKPRSDAPVNEEWLVVFYIGSEERNPSEDSSLVCSKSNETEAVDCYGNQSQLHNFTLQVQNSAPNGDTGQEGHLLSLRSDAVPPEGVWQAKSIYLSHVHSGTEQSGEGTLYFIQKGFKGSFELDIFFFSNETEGLMTSTQLTKGLDDSKLAFSNHFKSVYTPKPPFETPDYTNFSKAMLSNLLGGIGYFHGDSMADLASLSEYEEKDVDFWEEVARARSKVEPEVMQAKELFSMVPSRQFFPRGFLWDEGFHLFVVLDWDLDLAMDMTLRWLNLMDADGWIAREQILGSEARSAVPPQFRVQYPQHANPPTFFMVVSAFVDIITRKKSYTGHTSKYIDQPQLANDLLRSFYPLLNRHYQWFRTTQAGDLQSYTRPNHSENEAYRWRGRTPDSTFASGLDDYPRANPPHPGELHLDALSWVGSMAKAMTQISGFLDKVEDQAQFVEHGNAVKRNIEALHWCEERQVFCDATMDNNTHTLVCHKGYVSLFPFLVGLMEPTHLHLKSVLDLIKNDALWSPYGIRSLSTQDEYYRTGDDYWRSPIWININFMILEQLLNLATMRGPCQQQAREMYIDLRQNIVKTVCTSWQDTGFAWEHYNPDTGEGGGVEYFTGWTALVVKIVAMPDLRSSGSYRLSHLSGLVALDSHLVVSTAILVIFAFIFRRKLARMWTSMMSR